jgi:cell division protein FtsI (penicillin-binding protein 3)
MSELRLSPLERPVESASTVRRRARGRIRIVGQALSALLFIAGLRGAMMCVWPSANASRERILSRWRYEPLTPHRGDVVDRAGHKLATTVRSLDVVLDPAALTEAMEAQARDTALAADRRVDVVRDSARIAAALGRSDAAAIAAAMRLGKGKNYVLLADAVDHETAAKVDALKVPGLSTKWVGHRYYPEQTVAGQLLGYVRRDGDTAHGLEGLESSFETHLQGDSVYAVYRTGEPVDPIEAARGMDVLLTIDTVIQRAAERALEGIVDRFDPLWAAAVVVDVHTGELLAVANAPAFNPNAYGKASDHARRNHAVEEQIEPGSVLKPFVVAAALEEGRKADATIDCSYLPQFPQLRDTHPHGQLNVADIIKYSSNIGAAKLALELGGEKFERYMRGFGFGGKAGLRLPREAAGELDHAETLRGIRLVNNAFGQGMSASPVQLAYALAALGNGGQRMRAHVVSRVTDLHGVPGLVQNPAPVGGRVVSERNAAAVVAMMQTVTEEGGTAVNAQLPGYSVAGKTGTAQKPGPTGYGEDRVVSFIALVPAEAPVLSIVISVDSPKNIARPSGATVAAPAFVQLASEILPYLGIPPDRSRSEADEEAVLAAAIATDTPIRVVWRGDGWAIPDLRGRPLRSVLRALTPTGVALAVHGAGTLHSQSPPAGAIVTRAPADVLLHPSRASFHARTFRQTPASPAGVVSWSAALLRVESLVPTRLPPPDVPHSELARRPQNPGSACFSNSQTCGPWIRPPP